MSTGTWKNKTEKLICGAVGPPNPNSIKTQICNRIPGHEGPHRHYDPATFNVEGEWSDASQEKAPRRWKRP